MTVRKVPVVAVQVTQCRLGNRVQAPVSTQLLDHRSYSEAQAAGVEVVAEHATS